MTTRPPSRSRLRPFAGLLLLALLFAGGFGAWRHFSGSAAPPRDGGWRSGNEVVPVRVATAQREALALRLKTLGTVTPLNTVTVRSRVEGELVRVAFEEGQQVKAGDLLAEIDPRPFQVRLAQVQGQQQQNLAELANAQADLARYRDLQGKGYVSGQQLGTQEALVRQYEARRQVDQAAVDDARLQLAYTRITAPIGGRIGLRGVDVGNLVRTGDADGIATITQMAPISVLFTIPETDLPAVLAAVREDRTLPAEAWDREERQALATGTLASLDNRIDTTTGTLRLRALFENADESLYPNQFVNLRLQVSSADAIVIPNAAVQFGAKGNYVYVVGDDNKVGIRAITLGTADGERIAVTHGIAAGERVVLEGLDRLREGAVVEIIPDAPASGEPAGRS
ncbi:MdtA/MuxA family multidrug efflux RND transporter periplasmic adaptor subunit [Dokdonella koreensis]|uniref:Efflux transporter, RND family, MFP subunit n=1 Tax=Dokdonella koreensis DS-123 TaxID=1300342 RepID=A0A160DWE4_9GAMM|nr:MdtA/MuxA family multidrug efflux RND transporter periplasmic adaptor subunit [Dokdonella koreensis]ANB18938.1 Efflux transporter, RND family, MFP subunit [Dokdonella koreensis DS-123]